MFKKFKERKAKTQEEREIQKIDRRIASLQLEYEQEHDISKRIELNNKIRIELNKKRSIQEKRDNERLAEEQKQRDEMSNYFYRSLDNYQRNRPTIMNEMAREEEDYNMDKFSSKKIMINNTCKFRTKVSRFNS